MDIIGMDDNVAPTVDNPLGMYTTTILQAAGISQANAALYVDHLNSAADEFFINSPLRGAIFLSQVCWESEDFKYTRELWGPTAAQQRYDGRFGNTDPGDGYKYRGAGLIELTFKDNFAACSIALFGDRDILLNNPNKLSEPETACRAAGWFWQSRGCNELADQGDFTGVTKKINGGLNGLAGRIAIYKAIAPAYGLPST